MIRISNFRCYLNLSKEIQLGSIDRTCRAETAIYKQRTGLCWNGCHPSNLQINFWNIETIIFNISQFHRSAKKWFGKVKRIRKWSKVHVFKSETTFEKLQKEEPQAIRKLKKTTFGRSKNRKDCDFVTLEKDL